MTYKPKQYRGYTIHYMDGGKVQPLSLHDTRGYVFKTLNAALDWIDTVVLERKTREYVLGRIRLD